MVRAALVSGRDLSFYALRFLLLVLPEIAVESLGQG